MKSLFYYIIYALFINIVCFAGSKVYLDDQKTLGINISQSSGQTKISLNLFKFSPNDLSQKLSNVLGVGLKIYINGKPMGFNIKKSIGDSEIGYFDLTQKLYGSRVEIKLGNKKISEFSVSEDGKVTNEINTPISSYDLRQLSEVGSQHLSKISNLNKAPGAVIDLHTHFGGALRGESIVKVAYILGLTYSISFLKEMEIGFDSTKVNEKGEIKISDLDSKSLYKLIDNLNLNTLKVENFTKMEVYYKYRSPLVKSIQAFPLFLKELALDYKKNGVKYAELSISDV